MKGHLFSQLQLNKCIALLQAKRVVKEGKAIIIFQQGYCHRRMEQLLVGFKGAAQGKEIDHKKIKSSLNSIPRTLCIVIQGKLYFHDIIFYRTDYYISCDRKQSQHPKYEI